MGGGIEARASTPDSAPPKGTRWYSLLPSASFILSLFPTL